MVRWVLGWAIENIDILLRNLCVLFCKVSSSSFQNQGIILEDIKQIDIIKMQN